VTDCARLRVGLAGAGWVSAHHLDAWREVADRAVVVAIADPNRAAAAARAAQFAIPAVYDSVEAMLDGEALEALDIAVPRELHAPLCRLAAERGLAILCQKPLAPTYEEAVALVDEIGGRVRLMIHENWRFRPHYRRIRAWLDDGRIGEVGTAVMTILTAGLLPDAGGALPALVRQPMLARLERMLLMEVMIHHVDTLRFLLGPLVLEGARLGKRTAAIRGEDRVSLLLRGEGGAAVSLIGDFLAHGHPPAQRDRLEILGSAGAILLAEDRLRLTGATSEDVALDLDANYAASYRAAITHFVDRLRDGGAFETDPADNLETLKLVEAAYRVGG
jgi:D-apiose dehydrogenase